MICSAYEKLTIEEKVKMVGMITHAMQSDNEMFYMAKALINEAELKGVLDGVIILPSQNIDPTNNY